MRLWRQIWEGQGKRCSKCGQFVALKDTAKSSYSFKIVCRRCYDNPKQTMVILDEWGGILMEYTKGTWERHNSPGDNPKIPTEFIWAGYEHIANFDGEHANANAKLCASAPAMYEALKALYEDVMNKKVGTLTLGNARKALAQAERKL